MNNIAEILKSFKEKNILLLGHKSADADSVCSIVALSLGLKKLGFKVRGGVVEGMSKISQKILSELGEKIAVDPNFDADLIIMLDFSTEGQLSSRAVKMKDSSSKKMIIDHHAIQDYTLKADYVFIDEKAASTVELIYDLLRNLNIELDGRIAKAILLGTVAETAHLQFATLKNFQIIAELMQKFDLSYQWVLATLGTPLDVSERIARLKASQRVNFERVNNFLIATSKVKAFEASAARSLIRTGADFAAVAAEKETEVRISLRATQDFFKKTKLNLGKELAPAVSKIVNGTGSGHPTAAGINGSRVDKSDEALNYILEYTKNKLNTA